MTPTGQQFDTFLNKHVKGGKKTPRYKKHQFVRLRNITLQNKLTAPRILIDLPLFKANTFFCPLHLFTFEYQSPKQHSHKAQSTTSTFK